MNEKIVVNKPFIVLEQNVDRKEDMYALNYFEKVANRYRVSDELFSDELWNYLKTNFNIKNENITMFCELFSNVKNKFGKTYVYIIRIDKPYKIMFYFLDQEKIVDDYLEGDEKRNTIYDFTVYFDSDAADHVEKIINDVRNFIYFRPVNKTFFIISSTTMGYELNSAIVKDFDIQLDLNYGDSFVDKYNDILSKIKNNKHGLFLFHGDPGCGKCVVGDTFVTIRNKETGEIENISINDFEKLL